MPRIPRERRGGEGEDEANFGPTESHEGSVPMDDTPRDEHAAHDREPEAQRVEEGRTEEQQAAPEAGRVSVVDEHDGRADDDEYK